MGCGASSDQAKVQVQGKATVSSTSTGASKVLLGCSRAVTQPVDAEKPKEPFDLTKLWGWDSSRVWVCDILERPGEVDCDFLFMADIQASGTGQELKTQDAVSADRCIFQDVMYDVQKFTPDTTNDGKLDFDIAFGNNTAERRDAPNGWTVQFEDLVPMAKGRFKGTIVTSWWGRRGIILINYPELTRKEREQYPDMMTHHYFKSR